jgi:hypothetical protein
VRLALAAALTLAVAATTLAAVPSAGDRVLVPGRSLGGLMLGGSEADVRAAWGNRFGRCRSCAQPTWYFNERPFEPKGLGVEFRRGRVTALFTLWQPDGWRSTRGVRLGDPEARVGQLEGPTIRVGCAGYAALTQADGDAVTAFYVVYGRVWGFGLVRAGVPVCR